MGDKLKILVYETDAHDKVNVKLLRRADIAITFVDGVPVVHKNRDGSTDDVEVTFARRASVVERDRQVLDVQDAWRRLAESMAPIVEAFKEVERAINPIVLIERHRSRSAPEVDVISTLREAKGERVEMPWCTELDDALVILRRQGHEIEYDGRFARLVKDTDQPPADDL